MYWLVSLPHGGRPDQAWTTLQESTTYANDYSSNFKFALPESFRVGTLDSLLALSDDLQASRNRLVFCEGSCACLNMPCERMDSRPCCHPSCPRYQALPSGSSPGRRHTAALLAHSPLAPSLPPACLPLPCRRRSTLRWRAR